MTTPAIHLIDTRDSRWSAVFAAGMAARGGAPSSIVIGIGSGAGWKLHAAGIERAHTIAPAMGRAEFAARAIRRAAGDAAGTGSIVHAWSAGAAAAGRIAFPRSPLVVSLDESPEHLGSSAKRAVRSASAITGASPEVLGSWRSEMGHGGLAIPFPVEIRRDDDHHVRAARRAEWGLSDSDIAIGAVGEPASSVDAFAVSFVAGVLGVGGVKAAAIVPEGARFIERARRHSMAHEHPWPVIVDPRPPWEVLRGCDLAVWSCRRPASDHGRSMNPAPSVSALAWPAAMGVPIIAHEAPGVAETVGGEAGARIIRESSVGGPLALARAALSAIKEPDETRRRVEHARNHIGGHASIASFLEAIREAYARARPAGARWEHGARSLTAASR
ncbi:MAG TPA: hypothetical protein VG797_06855 [Phycisphaerales bacterium]|nr:hypothetical protein [Phycisphaerales bacterium]